MFKCTLFISFLLISNILCAQSNKNEILDKVEVLVANQQLDLAEGMLDSLINVTNADKERDVFLLMNARLIQLYNRMGLSNKGVEIGEKLYSNQNRILQEKTPALVAFYMHWGYAYNLTQSNSQKALLYLNLSLNLYQKLNFSDPELEAKIYLYLGGTQYYEGDYEASISSVSRAIKLLDPETEKSQIAICLRGIGNAYWGLRKYDEASDHYEQAIHILLNDNPIDSLTIGRVLHAKGYIHMDQEDYQKAYKTFQEASNLMSKKHPKVSAAMVWVYGDVGRALMNLGKYDSSLIWLQKALIANVFDYEEEDYYQNPPLQDINDDFQHFMILKLKGQVFQKKYLLSNQKEDLNEMINSFLLADKQIDEIRKSISRSEDQSSISYYSNELYSQAINALVELNTLKPNSNYLTLAHYFLERQKITRVYLKFLEATAKLEGLLPEEVLEQDQELLNTISTLKSRLKEEYSVNGDSIEIFKKKLFDAQDQYENFTSILKKDYPSYHSSRFDLNVSSLEEVQTFLQKLAPNRAIVTYYDFGEKFVSSVITKDTSSIQVTKHEFDLYELSNNFRNYLTNPSESNQQNMELTTLLTKGVFSNELMKGINEVTIIPDPAIQLIPVELIQFEDQFLFEKYDVGYHFSSTMLLNQSKPSNTSNSFIGFAPSFDSLEFQQLPGAEKEIQSIMDVYDGQSFVGEYALEDYFKNSKAGIIHLATHAQIDEINPESSFLQFSSSGKREDGKLHFFEIYNLHLNAQLVTLSACNSGYGKIQRGEGVMSLSRAFSYAGIPATVVSLWPASDKSTPELMKHFYQNLKGGQSKDVALNNARKQYLSVAQGKARHPFYWGGFVLIGDHSPIDEDSNLLIYLIASTLVIVLIVTILRKKRSQT